MRKKIGLAAGAIALLLALAQIWSPAEGQSPTPASTAASEAGAAAATRGLRIEGRLTPRQWAVLGSAAARRAAEVYVQEGEQVEAGQVLIRSDQYPARQADAASAALELRLAQQALEDLEQRAGVELAEAEAALARARDEQALAHDLYKSLSAPVAQDRIAQAHANLLLEANRLERARDDLAKVRRQYANKKNILWYFINKRQFRLMITLKEQGAAYHEQRYLDAKEKYEDLLEGADPLDVALAEARWTAAETTLANAQRRRGELVNGPDPDKLELAQARLRAAEAGLAAAQAALRQTEITAPFAGQVVALRVKAGEWMQVGTPAIIVADLSRWKVESSDLDEINLPNLEVGQSVRLSLEALPELDLSGTVENIDRYYFESDGDIYYAVDIDLEASDPALRWGMTVQIDVR